MCISRRILLRMRNVSDKRCREIHIIKQTRRTFFKSQCVCTLNVSNGFITNIEFFDNVYTLFLLIELYNFHFIVSERYLMYVACNLTYYYLTLKNADFLYILFQSSYQFVQRTFFHI